MRSRSRLFPSISTCQRDAVNCSGRRRAGSPIATPVSVLSGAGAHGGVLVTGGKGSHELWETGGGLQIRFATSAGFLLHPEEKAIRHAFGLSREDLFRAVMGA